MHRRNYDINAVKKCCNGFLQSCPFRFHKKFTESGDYWVFVSNQEFIHHDCKLLQTNDPLPAEMRERLIS